MLTVSMLVLGMLTMLGTSEDSWDLGSSKDWLGTGPVYHVGPFFYPIYPDSDLSQGTQQFLNTYPSYIPPGYSNYYQTRKPVVLGNYTPSANYMPGYNPYFYNNPYFYSNPYYYNPQAELDYAVANHAYQKYLTNYYNRYYWNYGPQWWV
jgi:hypothetical protein